MTWKRVQEFKSSKVNNNEKAFFALLRGGLWEKDVELRKYGTTDFEEIMRLAEQQSVVGLITSGMERATDKSVPKAELLQFIGQTLQIEEQNKAMNYFIGVIIEALQKEKIYAVLVKGQGIAQCYERPLWRTSGDVDLFLDAENYEKAKAFLIPLAEHVENEHRGRLHQGMTIGGWVVELHGSMRTSLSKRVDRGIDEVQRDVFRNGSVREWMNDRVEVLLPSVDNDVIFVFTHFVNHFYREGVGIRQICDWCRLLWRYRAELDILLLESRIIRMGLMEEWRAFGAFAVEWLGMPEEAMPLLNKNEPSTNSGQVDEKLKRKSGRIMRMVMEMGNFGHNIDQSYRGKYPKLVEWPITLWRRVGEYLNRAMIFPGNATKFFLIYLWQKVRGGV